MKRVIEIFRDKEELNKLVNTPNPKYKSGIRSRAILALLCFAGLRVSELVNLRPEDIRENDNCIYINNSKYNSSRVVYIPDYVFVYIINWQIVKPESEYLFCSRYKRKLCNAYIQKMVKRYAKRIDINKNIHPHCLRHYVERYIMVSVAAIVR